MEDGVVLFLDQLRCQQVRCVRTVLSFGALIELGNPGHEWNVGVDGGRKIHREAHVLGGVARRWAENMRRDLALR